jgi:hypothetical protein
LTWHLLRPRLGLLKGKRKKKKEKVKDGEVQGKRK